MEKIRVRVPQVVDVETAVRLFYERMEFSISDIKTLFNVSDTTARKLKAKGVEQQREDNIPMWNASQVHVVSAFKAWGLDIADLEARLKKLRQLKLREASNAES